MTGAILMPQTSIDTGRETWEDTATAWSCQNQAGYLLHTRHVAVSLVAGLWQINCLHHRPRGPCCSPREAIDQERIGNKDGGIRPRNHAHKQGKSKVV